MGKGESYPTIKQAQKLAKIYRRPFALFFFPEMPEDFMKSITISASNKVKVKDSPIYYPILANKNGKLFIQTVLNAYRTGEIEVSRASFY